MPGGWSQHAVDATVQDLVSGHKAAINAQTHVNAANWKIDKAWSQVVAGTNYFVHLTSNDGKHASASFYVPLPHTNAPAELKFAEAGHTGARNQK